MFPSFSQLINSSLLLLSYGFIFSSVSMHKLSAIFIFYSFGLSISPLGNTKSRELQYFKYKSAAFLSSAFCSISEEKRMCGQALSCHCIKCSQGTILSLSKNYKSVDYDQCHNHLCLTLSSVYASIYLIKSNFDYIYRTILKVILLNLR